MDIPERVQDFWAGFLAKSGRRQDSALYDVFYFDDNEASANELAELVLRGTKVATASLLWEYEGEGYTD